MLSLANISLAAIRPSAVNVQHRMLNAIIGSNAAP